MKKKSTVPFFKDITPNINIYQKYVKFHTITANIHSKSNTTHVLHDKFSKYKNTNNIIQILHAYRHRQKMEMEFQTFKRSVLSKSHTTNVIHNSFILDRLTKY